MLHETRTLIFFQLYVKFYKKKKINKLVEKNIIAYDIIIRAPGVLNNTIVYIR